MEKEEFFQHYPKRKKDSNKFDNGRVFLLSGSYGMAGACILNIIGARSAGASYIDVCLPDTIYPIAASKEITAVYHPDTCQDPSFLKGIPALKKADAVAAGSGLTNHPLKKEYLKDILETVKVPVILDAEALHILAENEELYGLSDKMILTPHYGEFAHLVHKPLEEIRENIADLAVDLAIQKNVTLVLKGPKTLIISAGGRVHVNETGNEALARAGSGDVLTGMMAGLCALYHNTYQAAVHAVWLHGHLADETVKTHSKEVFDLTKYPEYADRFFFER